MARVTIPLAEALPELLPLLGGAGALLTASDAEGRANTMTIGWATFGIVWGKPIATALVRPSRYTYGFTEASDEFTISVLDDSYRAALAFCGSKSGREVDKFAATGLGLAAGEATRTPVIAQAFLNLECRTLYRHDLAADALPAHIRDSCYPKGDFHRLYYGEVLACYRVTRD